MDVTLLQTVRTRAAVDLYRCPPQCLTGPSVCGARYVLIDMTVWLPGSVEDGFVQKFLDFRSQLPIVGLALATILWVAHLFQLP